MPERKPRRLRIGRDTGLLLLNLLLVALAAALFPRFASPANLADVLDDTGILILLALGEACVVLTRAVDLSVASNLAFCGMASALLNQYLPWLGLGAVVAAVALGAALGAVNGLLVWVVRIPSIVVTLGTLAIYRGLVFVISGGAWVNSNQMTERFLAAVRLHVLGLSAVAWLALAGSAAAWLLLRYGTLGRNLYAAGSNPVAATYSGIDVGRTQFAAFTLCGAVAGLCGYLWVARYAVAYTQVAQGFELQAIAACVIGGVSIAGGVGTVPGLVLGALFLGLVKNALPLVGVSPFWQMAVSGVVITVAVLLNARGARSPGRRILETA